MDSYRGGFFYTAFIVDPQNELFGIFMSQLAPTGGLDLSDQYGKILYEALKD